MHRLNKLESHQVFIKDLSNDINFRYTNKPQRNLRNLSRMQLNSVIDTSSTIGPNEKNFKEILDRNNLCAEVTNVHRRIYSINKLCNELEMIRCQLFCGRIPLDVLEDELFLLFEPFGKLLELRLILNLSKKQNPRFAIICFAQASACENAQQMLNNFEIRPEKQLKISKYTPITRLYIGNIPKSKDSFELKSEFDKHLIGIIDLILYRPMDSRQLNKNRGFCFLEFGTHDAARLAKGKIARGQANLWGCAIFVDWADILATPSIEIMNEVRVLYVRNIAVNAVNDDRLRELFEKFGVVERVKIMKDFAFVHFLQREDAAKAMNALHHFELDGERIEITWSRPPSGKRQKEEMLRGREIRMLRNQFGKSTFVTQSM